MNLEKNRSATVSAVTAPYEKSVMEYEQYAD
jgi:hypothetical protein